MRGLSAMAVLFIGVGSLVAQESGEASIQVHEEDGGSVAVRTANGMLNQDSSLKRKWYVIDDKNSPVWLDHAGVFSRFDAKENVQYLVPVGAVSPKQLISAIEVRYLLFDVWGDRFRTLSVTRLTDSSSSIDFRDNNRWPALESEVSQFLTTVAFVARVQTAEGRVWSFDEDRVLAQIQTLGKNVHPVDLTPDDQPTIKPGVIFWRYSPQRKDTR